MEGHRNSEGEGILKANIFEGKSEIQMEYPKGQGQEKEIKTKKKTLNRMSWNSYYAGSVQRK